MFAILAAVILQQAASGQVVWQTPAPPEPVAACCRMTAATRASMRTSRYVHP